MTQHFRIFFTVVLQTAFTHRRSLRYLIFRHHRTIFNDGLVRSCRWNSAVISTVLFLNPSWLECELVVTQMAPLGPDVNIPLIIQSPVGVLLCLHSA